MKLVENLFPIAVVAAIVVNYLQGYYRAKGRAKERPCISGRRFPLSAALRARDAADNERQVDPIGDPFLTAELPRDWLDAAMPEQEPNWAEQSMDCAEDRRFTESLETSRDSHIDDHRRQNDFGLINPANGLPMLGDGPIDIAGNSYGEDGSQPDWGSASHDSFSSEGYKSSNSSSSWDDYR
jgi:hypothetical protein